MGEEESAQGPRLRISHVLYLLVARTVSGMFCEGCSSRVFAKVVELQSVEDAEIDHTLNSAKIKLKISATAEIEDQLARLITELGFQVTK